MTVKYLHRDEETGAIFPIEVGKFEEFLGRSHLSDYLMDLQEPQPGTYDVDLDRCLVKWVGTADTLQTVSAEIPSLEISDVCTGHIYFRHFRDSGKTHRFDGPAIIFDDGNFVREEFWEKGVEHRESGPQTIISDKRDGFVYEEIYRERGDFHRIGQPARVRFNEQTRVLEYEFFYENGQMIHPPNPSIDHQL
ncbi:MAG: hypothetical protein AAFQ12_04990 [Pseudomonadota bacterium]